MDKDKLTNILTQCLGLMDTIAVAGEDKRRLVSIEDALKFVITETHKERAALEEPSTNGAANLE